MCAECHRSSVTASKFSDKCHRAFEKLERSGVRGAALVWGQGQSLLERQRQVVSAGGGVEYNKTIHGQLKFPRINLSKEDRARAEDHKARSETKRRQESWQFIVQIPPAGVSDHICTTPLSRPDLQQQLAGGTHRPITAARPPGQPITVQLWSTDKETKEFVQCQIVLFYLCWQVTRDVIEIILPFRKDIEVD